MRFCAWERADFPEDQFVEVEGRVMHSPPDGLPHPAEARKRGPRLPPARMSTPWEPVEHEVDEDLLRHVDLGGESESDAEPVAEEDDTDRPPADG